MAQESAFEPVLTRDAQRHRLALLVKVAASAGDFSPKLSKAVERATDEEVRVLVDLLDRGMSIPRLVNVLLGAPNKAVRLQTASRMVETGFDAAEALAAKDAAGKNQKAKTNKKNNAAPAAKSRKIVKKVDESAGAQASLARQALP